jgi:hypothetical protein
MSNELALNEMKNNLNSLSFFKESALNGELALRELTLQDSALQHAKRINAFLLYRAKQLKFLPMFYGKTTQILPTVLR